jgi:hypothetical protein
MRWFCVALSLALVLSACSKAPQTLTNQSATKPGSSLKPFDGWNSLKFGMSFDEALIAEAGISWDGQSFRECREQIPAKGCKLWADEERSYAPLYAGVSLLPRVQFNLDGVITDVELAKSLKSMTPAQCEGAHGRVLDQLIKDWGNRKTDSSKADSLLRKSPGGTTFGRTKGLEGIFVMDIERFNKLPDGREISLLTTYIPKSEYSPSRCDIGVYFDGPKNLARAPINTAATPDQSDTVMQSNSGETAAEGLTDESGNEENASGVLDD